MSKSNNKIGVVQLTILTIVNMMGSGIIMLPTQLAQVGTISILSWLVTAAGSTALAFAFAKCGMFSKNPAVWVVTPNTRLAAAATLWPTIPMRFPC